MTMLNENVDEAANGLLFLTEIAYEITGKRSYLLIDEYDKLLIEKRGTDLYEEIRNFKTALFSAGVKGNPYLEKALFTGVMRISHESMFSGLNNITTFDVFSDKTYVDDYGFTEDEVIALSKVAQFDIEQIRQWYNGVRIGNKPIYNTYSVMSYLFREEFGCFWGNSGTMHIIVDLLNNSRRATLAKLLTGEKVAVFVADRVSLRDLAGNTGDRAFYSLLVQAGYLALWELSKETTKPSLVSIPNTELMIVWKEFILDKLYPDLPQIRTLFENADKPELFSKDLEYFLRDRLSYHDLAIYKDQDAERVHERLYHIFLLGILSAYEDVQCKYPLSNRESGDGRYDILVERSNTNFIFEFKISKDAETLEQSAKEALEQIETKRYGADLNNGKNLVKIGVAIYEKTCKVIAV